MPRLRLYDMRIGRLPPAVGLCQSDGPRIAQYVNAAQRRLLLGREAGDEGWWGTFAEVAFSGVSASNPYITMPRQIARIEKLNVCTRPIPMFNQYYEYLDFGNGRMPKLVQYDNYFIPSGYSRNNVVTFTDQSVSPCYIQIYSTDPADVANAKRVLIQGYDSSGSVIYSQDNFNQVIGVFVNIASPFATCPVQISQLTGIQKDVTAGDVQIFQVDPTTGTQTLLLTMQPSETVAGYRRYYLHNLPCNCCQLPGTDPQNLTVTAIVKLEVIPVSVDTDYLLFQNEEAIIEEAQSVRYSVIDSSGAKQMAQEKHTQAVRLLQGELVHYLGKTEASVNFAPFGTARLACQSIGTMI